MGFWDELKKVGTELAKVGAEGMAHYAVIEQVASGIREKPRSEWVTIIQGGITKAEKSQFDMNAWTRSLVERLRDLEQSDKRYEGLLLLNAGAFAAHGLQNWHDHDRAKPG